MFSRYLNFCLGFLGMWKNDLIRKVRLISKLITSQHGKQSIIIHILLNISGIKDNQTMKLGKLTEYKKTNYFLQKSCWKWGRETTILVIIFWDILIFDKIFVSPQVKRIVIISNKNGIYELPHELPNELRLRTLGN